VKLRVSTEPSKTIKALRVRSGSMIKDGAVEPVGVGRLPDDVVVLSEEAASRKRQRRERMESLCVGVFNRGREIIGYWERGKIGWYGNFVD